MDKIFRALLCVGFVALAAATTTACQRESVAPEMGNAPARAPTDKEAPAETAASTGARAPAAGAPAPGANALTLVTSGAPHPHVADSSGRALYYVVGDKDGGKCTGPCLDAWPPFLATETMPSGGPNLQADMIGVVTRPEGQRQVSYNQHPLYRYAGDAGAGRANGHGVKDKYGHWYLIGADGMPLPAADMQSPPTEQAAH